MASAALTTDRVLDYLLRQVKATAKEGALGQMSKNFQFYFIRIIFFKKPNQKNLQ